MLAESESMGPKHPEEVRDAFGRKRSLEGPEEEMRKIQDNIQNEVGDCMYSLSGSLVKGTFVWGVSDIDLLCYSDAWSGTSPGNCGERIAEAVRDDFELRYGTGSVYAKVGKRTFLDVVPALLKNDKHLITPSRDATEWVRSDPSKFLSHLERLEDRCSVNVRAAVQAVKFFFRSWLSEEQLSGHHAECIVAKVIGDTTCDEDLVDTFHKAVNYTPIALRDRLKDESELFNYVGDYMETDERNKVLERAFVIAKEAQHIA